MIKQTFKTGEGRVRGRLFDESEIEKGSKEEGICCKGRKCCQEPSKKANSVQDMCAIRGYKTITGDRLLRLRA